MDRGVLDQVPYGDGEGIGIDAVRELGAGVLLIGDPSAARRIGFGIADHELEDRAKVDRVVGAGEAGFETRQLEQFLRKFGEAAEGLLDAFHAGGGGMVSEFGGEALGLRQGAGNRRAQLVSAAGRESAFRFHGGAQTAEKGGDLAGYGNKLGGLVGIVQRRKVGAVAGGDVAAEARNGEERRADGEPDRHGDQRDQGGKGPKQAGDGVPKGIGAGIRWFRAQGCEGRCDGPRWRKRGGR